MSAEPLTVSVVVVTYEWPDALDCVLRALAEELDASSEVIVADDGSGPETAAVVDRRRPAFRGRLVHVRQENRGWRKSRILDLGAGQAEGELLAFLDGDCIPRRGFLAAIRRAALPGWFLASKRLNLNPDLSQRVIAEGLPVWRWSALRWLARFPRELVAAPREERNRPGVLLPLRDRRRPWRKAQSEFTIPYAAGFFLGIARSDFDHVNGFDLRFEGWGGEDVDIAARLRHSGLRCGWPGPRATMLHLWHEQMKGKMKSNKPLAQDTKARKRVEAVAGLRELVPEPGDQVSA